MTCQCRNTPSCAMTMLVDNWLHVVSTYTYTYTFRTMKKVLLGPMLRGKVNWPRVDLFRHQIASTLTFTPLYPTRGGALDPTLLLVARLSLQSVTLHYNICGKHQALSTSHKTTISLRNKIQSITYHTRSQPLIKTRHQLTTDRSRPTALRDKSQPITNHTRSQFFNKTRHWH